MGLFGSKVGKILGVALVAVAAVAVVATGGTAAAPAAAGLLGSGGTAFAATVTGKILTALAFTIGQSLVFAQKAPKFKAGIQTSAPTVGEDTPLSFIVGRRYATAGSRAYPILTFGSPFTGLFDLNGSEFLVQIIELSDLPGSDLIRVSVNGEWIDLDRSVEGIWGWQATGKYADRIWVKYYDGSQTTADQGVLDVFGSHPDFPYDSTMVRAGKCYAITRAKFDPKLFPTQPKFIFEMTGTPMYDPRKDTTVGGSGAHRWADKTTWEKTGNPAVVKYNIMRGIEFPGGDVWGGKATAADLPVDEWFAAMNDDDEQIEIGTGIGNRYECGFEVKTNVEPADIIEEINKSDSGNIADVGGVWYPRSGAPDLPVLTITDGDMLSAEPVNFNPHSGPEQTTNAAKATYPDPEQIYEPRATPTRLNATWEAEDGGKRRLLNITLSAVPFPGRAQIIAKELHEDARRQARHILAVHRSAAFLRPLQTIDFTSDHFGHVDKDFEVFGIALDLLTFNAQLVAREVNPADFTPPTIEDTTLASPVAPVASAIAVKGFDVTAVDIVDDAGTARRPGFDAVWTDPPLDAVGAQIQMRVTLTSVLVKTHSVSGVQDESFLISEGVLPGVQYDLRMRYVVTNRPATWTAWITVTANNAQLVAADMASSSITEPKIAPEAVTGPKVAPYAVDSTKLAQAVRDDIAAGLDALAAAPIVVGSLPANGDFEGQLAFLTTDKKLYRWTGAAWTVAVDGADILANTITAGQISAGAVGATEIAAGSVGTEQLIVADTTGNMIPNGAFNSGDFRGWTRAPSTFSIVAKDPDSAIVAVQNIPTKFALRMSESTVAKFFQILLPEAVKAGDQITFSMQHGGQVNSTAVIAIRIRYLDIANVNVDTKALNVANPGAGWASASVSDTVPAGAVRIVFDVNRLADGGDPIYATDFEIIRRRPGATIITPQGITTDLMAANSITAASGIIDDLAVDNLQIAGAAVTTPKLAQNAATVPLFSFTSASLALTTSDSIIASVTNATELALFFSPVQIVASFRLVFTPPSTEQVMPVIITLSRRNAADFSTTFTEFSVDGSTTTLQKIYTFHFESTITDFPASLPEAFDIKLRKNSTNYDVDVNIRSIQILGLKR